MLILASASPRRRELLTQIGVYFECRSADIDESVRAAESPAVYVSRLALEKALVVAALAPDVWVLGCDTSVICEQQILGKPTHKEEAVTMLLSLSGRHHQVLTAVALVRGEQRHTLLVITDVWFKTLSRTACEAYWETGEPQGKAGSYAIQGFGAVFVERIEGSYSAVVGLPLQETAQLLQQLAVPIWQQDDSKQAP
ncbi:MAG: septum formation protein [Motiliproteus sp.]